MQKIHELLIQLGLNDKEARVFLSMVKLGPAPVGKVAMNSGITRTHVYDIAEELKERGFVSAVEKRGVRIYEALEHAGLLALISRKYKELEALEKKVAESVSDFEQLRAGARQKTKVRFFEGAAGVLNIYEEIKSDLRKLKEPFEIITIFSPDKLEKTFPGWFDEKHIDIPPYMIKRDIVHESEIFSKHLKDREKSASQYSYKIWPKAKGEFPADTLCWQNKIAYVELAEYPSGVVIENEAIVQTFKMWFEKMWEGL